MCFETEENTDTGTCDTVTYGAIGPDAVEDTA